MSVAHNIAEFIVATHYADLPAEAVVAARRTLLDTLGVAVAGAHEAASRIMTAQARGVGARPSATVIGGGFRTTVTEAALVNGVLAHVLDYDDVGNHAQGHLSAVLYPAALAVAEEQGNTGEELVAAYVLGVETWARIAATMPMLHTKGWHPTAVFGTLGASMAAAKLMRLDVERTTMALGIAASMAAGLTQNFGTFTKSLHAGNAARNGILAARLARDGFTAAPDILEGPLGFAVAFFHGQPVDVEAMAAGLGRPFALVQGVNVKKYPCCLMPHRAVDAVIHLAQQHDLAADDIAEIDCELPPLAAKILFYDEPADGLEAKFSLHHCLAMAVIDRRLGLAQFADEKVRSPGTRALARKVRMRTYAGAGERETGENRPDTVVVRLKDGTELSHSVLRAKGHAEVPLTWDELVDKFRDAAGRVLDEQTVARTVEIVGRMEKLPDVRELMSGLAQESAG